MSEDNDKELRINSTCLSSIHIGGLCVQRYTHDAVSQHPCSSRADETSGRERQ